MAERFSAINHPIAIDGGVGRLASVTDYGEHVDQLIRQLLLTVPGERINRPDFGCGLRRMVFAPNSDVSASLVRVTVLQALDKWLASVVEPEQVDVVADQEKLVVTLRYILRVRRERRYLNVEVSI